ncbi:hypothetical protein PoB_001403100 [Plakobranchus ocellatus]|uniref:Uncharacterized protein n=1 Tax=Plakobranchus ocellatus TaxID=259542 RepID=A0AAV3YVP0_9GAST|nr:hypothetical protein PoB_001403100 [Plakobranchus ocellatus]
MPNKAYTQDFKSDGRKMGLHEIDFGARFVQELSKMSTNANRCRDMLVGALNQINICNRALQESFHPFSRIRPQPNKERRRQ